MNTLTNLLGKTLISLFNSQKEGIIKNAIFDKRLSKLKYLTILNEDNDTDFEFVLAIKDIYFIGQDAVIIKNNNVLGPFDSLDLSQFRFNPINNEVFTTKGYKKGIIKDVIFNEKLEINFLKLDSNNILETNTILNCGNNVIVVNDTNKKMNISNFDNKKPKTKITKHLVDALNLPSMTSPLLEVSKNIPKKITSQSTFVLGRTLNKNIFSNSQEIIAKKDTIITTKTLENVKKYGKLKELYIFSS